MSRAALTAAFGAVYLGWGSLYLAIRYAVETLPPFLMAGTSAVLAGVLLYAWEAFRGTPRPTLRQWRTAFCAGALLLLVGNGGVVWGEQFVVSSLTTLLLASEPCWMVLLDWLLFGGSRPTGKVLAGVALGFAGVGVLLAGPADGRAAHPWGIAMILVAALAWSLGTLYCRQAPLPKAPVLAIAMPIFVGGLLLLGASLAAGEWRDFSLEAVSARSAWAFAYITFVSYIVTYSAYAWLLKTVSIEKLSTYAFVNPLVAVFLGWAVAGEEVNARTIAGAAVILTAVLFILKGGRKPGLA